MKTIITILILLLAFGNLEIQAQFTDEKAETGSPINIGLNESRKSFIPSSLNLKSGTTKTSTITVDYTNFPEEAKSAFQYAVSIWEQSISSTVTIHISATWENLEGNVIAQSRPSLFYKNFIEAPISDVYYPIALVEKLSGRDYNDINEPDIICNFNNLKSFYFGTDGKTPTTQYDFVTVVLHEITHGMGISGFITDENGIGKINNTTNSPSAFDFYIFNKSDQRITDNTLFAIPSTVLHSQITSDKLDFISTSTDGLKSASNIYAPQTWNNGASIYHLKDLNELMKPFSYKGEAIHNIGNSTLQILSEIGWNEVSLKLAEIKDIEETCNELPINTMLINNLSIHNSSLVLVFSTNNFSTKDSVTFTYNQNNNTFEGNLPIASFKGKIQYYFRAKGTDGNSYTYPNRAPGNIASFKIGPDYYPPILVHNPLKVLTSQEIDFSAIASDNVGINSVKIEYTINGTEQTPFELSQTSFDVYQGKLQLPQVTANDLVEYRVIAEDNSNRKNRKYLPSTGYYTLENQNISTANYEIAANINKDVNVNIYPNPFSSNFFIDCGNLTEQSSVDIIITDLAGKIVFQERNMDILFNPKIQVNLSSINSGMYLASVTDENSNKITKRIIKN